MQRKSTLGKLVSHLGSTASIYGAVIINSGPLAISFYLCFAVLFILTAYFIVKHDRDLKICRNDLDIDNEMKKIVSRKGRMLIMTRDMSWCNDNSEIWRSLIKKANDRELEIFMAEETPNSKKLENNGALIKYYGNIGFEPKVRFTLMHYKTPSAKVAIGYKNKDDKHVIQYYRMDTSSPIHLAEDITRLLEKIHERNS